MDENGKEILIGENRLLLGEDNIIYQTIVGVVDEEKATAMRDATTKLMGMIDGKMNILVDLNKAGKPSPEAKRIMNHINFEYESIGKVALYGIHPVARVIASFFMRVTKEFNMHFFKTKEDAIAWLKEEN
jgi:hypothetical protein